MRKLPKHLMASDDGNLYDCRVGVKLLRANYDRHVINIKTVADFKATLRAGPYAWPGGYPCYFVMSDGESLSFEAAKQEFKQIVYAIRHGLKDGWRVVGCDVNYESLLYCAHTGKQIESAYDPISEEESAA